MFTRSRPKGRSLSPPPPSSSSSLTDDTYEKSDKPFPLSSSGMTYDVESGTLPGPRSLRRALTRRTRIVLAALATVSVLYYLTSGTTSFDPGLPPVTPPPVPELDDFVLDDIWDDLPPPIEGPPHGKAPEPPSRPPRPDHPRYYIIDENDDHYLPNVGRKVASLHPGDKDLKKPEELFPDVDLATFFKPPKVKVFPEERLREIISDPPETDLPREEGKLPPESFAATWKAPADWDAATPGAKEVQWSSFKTKDKAWESAKQKAIRIQRRDAVKRGFAWAWQGYKDKAWGHDEVRPKSGHASDPFNAWGASIVDTLDTLLVMGLEDEYNLCRPHVNQLNFDWISGRDWAHGYQAPESEGGWTIPRDRRTGLPVFETGIRYLGGLLGAYDLSGDKLMLERAIDVAEILGRAFNTQSGLPQGSRIDPGQESSLYVLSSVSIAEVGSMTLELTRLSQATGDRKWFDLAHRAIEFLDQKAAPRSKYAPLLPMNFAPDSNAKISGTYSFGAMTDSYYEYLVKQVKLLGGGEMAKVYQKLYEDSMDAARELLFVNIDIIPDRDLFTIGKWEGGQLKHETEHLACFAGGMLGYGGKMLDRPKDMKDGSRFTTTCYWLSAGTPTGIQPETVQYYHQEDKTAYINKTTYGYNWHPPIPQPWSEKKMDKSTMYKDFEGEIRWFDDKTPVRNDSGRAPNRPITYYRYIQGIPAGTSRVTGYYINRPETIESVFYMYRLTGDRGWQDKGWRMFGSWMNHSRVDHGVSSIQDVTRDVDTIVHGDNMESFVFAETFKYHFLLQSEPDVLSLDDFVYNTEAHPLIANFERDMKPGEQGWWHELSAAGQDLGVRGQGTNVQKWLRDQVLSSPRHQASKKLNDDAGKAAKAAVAV